MADAALVSKLTPILTAVKTAMGAYREAYTRDIGHHGEVFVAAALERLVNDAGERFVLNYTPLVNDAPLARLRLTSFEVTGSAEKNDYLQAVWTANQMDIRHRAILRRAAAMQDSPVFIKPAERLKDPSSVPVIIDVDPRRARVLYEDDNPVLKTRAIRFKPQTADIKGNWILEIHSADGSVEQFITDSAAATARLDPNNYKPLDRFDNGCGTLLAVHFRSRLTDPNNPFLIQPVSRPMWGAQDSLHKSWALMKSAEDYQAFNSRYAIQSLEEAAYDDISDDDSADFEDTEPNPTADPDYRKHHRGRYSQSVEQGPGILTVLKGEWKVGEWKSMDFTGPLELWEKARNSIPELANVPHALLNMQGDQGGDPNYRSSGTKMDRVEVNFTKSCIDFKQLWDSATVELMEKLLIAGGYGPLGEGEEIVTTWTRPDGRDDDEVLADVAQSVQMFASAATALNTLNATITQASISSSPAGDSVSESIVGAPPAATSAKPAAEKKSADPDKDGDDDSSAATDTDSDAEPAPAPAPLPVVDPIFTREELLAVKDRLMAALPQV